MITDQQLQAAVKTYLRITGDTREQFIQSLNDMAQQHVGHEFADILQDKPVIKLAHHP